MAKFEIKLDSKENIESVYDHYADRKIHKYQTIPFHYGLSKLLKPNSIWENGAEQKVADHLNKGGQLIWSQNHVSDYDPFHIAAEAHAQKSLHPLIGRTFIPSKEDLFAIDKPANKLQRYVFDAVGAIPVSRNKDPALRAYANELLIKTCVYRVGVRRESMSIFTEAHRNKENPRQLQRIKDGMGQIAVRSMDLGANIMILPMAFWYGEGENKNLKCPTLYYGEPFTPEGNPENVVQEFKPRLQDCLDKAINNHVA